MKKQKNKPPLIQPQEYWLSYSDLMAGLLLIFMLLIVVVLQSSKQSLEDERQKLKKQQEKFEQLNNDHTKLNKDIDQVLGVRTKILQRLRQRFNEKGSNISFDDATGAVRLGSDILFPEGSSRLLPEGKQALDQTMPIYFEALLGDEELKKHVDQIIIEGHTNSNYSGSKNEQDAYLFNLRLSQERAYEAMEYIIRSREHENHFKLLAANGYSNTRLVKKKETGEEDKERSRRIELRFRLKDEEALNDLRAKLASRKSLSAQVP